MYKQSNLNAHAVSFVPRSIPLEVGKNAPAYVDEDESVDDEINYEDDNHLDNHLFDGVEALEHSSADLVVSYTLEEATNALANPNYSEDISKSKDSLARRSAEIHCLEYLKDVSSSLMLTHIQRIEDSKQFADDAFDIHTSEEEWKTAYIRQYLILLGQEEFECLVNTIINAYECTMPKEAVSEIKEAAKLSVEMTIPQGTKEWVDAAIESFIEMAGLRVQYYSHAITCYAENYLADLTNPDDAFMMNLAGAIEHFSRAFVANILSQETDAIRNKDWYYDAIVEYESHMHTFVSHQLIDDNDDEILAAHLDKSTDEIHHLDETAAISSSDSVSSEITDDGITNAPSLLSASSPTCSPCNRLDQAKEDAEPLLKNKEVIKYIQEDENDVITMKDLVLMASIENHFNTLLGLLLRPKSQALFENLRKAILSEESKAAAIEARSSAPPQQVGGGGAVKPAARSAKPKDPTYPNLPHIPCKAGANCGFKKEDGGSCDRNHKPQAQPAARSAKPKDLTYPNLPDIPCKAGANCGFKKEDGGSCDRNHKPQAQPAAPVQVPKGRL